MLVSALGDKSAQAGGAKKEFVKPKTASSTARATPRVRPLRLLIIYNSSQTFSVLVMCCCCVAVAQMARRQLI